VAQTHVKANASWMEITGFAVVNSEKTIRMKHKRSDSLPVHAHAFSCCNQGRVHATVLEEFDITTTVGHLIKTFLGMEVEQTACSVKINLDH
jgi:hypothetical protein